MSTRFRNTGETLNDFCDHILIVCPQCGKQAAVSKTADAGQERVSLTCGHCGLAKQKNEFSTTTSDEPVDPFFRMQVWLQGQVAGHTLWAYNEKHLKFLEDFVGAELRVNDAPVANRSLASRLPQWMKAAKNRDDVLSALAKLRKKL